MGAPVTCTLCTRHKSRGGMANPDKCHYHLDETDRRGEKERIKSKRDTGKRRENRTF